MNSLFQLLCDLIYSLLCDQNIFFHMIDSSSSLIVGALLAAENLITRGLKNKDTYNLK